MTRRVHVWSDHDVTGPIEQLKAVVGPSGWIEGPAMERHLVDERGDFSGTALLVVRPSNTTEVADVVKVCAAAGLAVLPQGGNTGLSGGSVPSADQPTVLLSLNRMTTIEDVNPGRFTITVQAGATVEAVQDAASSAKRLFAPDWGARGTATIGGAIATNAGGINVLRYGNMREQVLGLEVVMGDGRVWNGLRSLPKDNSGYDLKQLFIGSEGTLGIVTRSVLRLHPQPRVTRTAFVALAGIERLTELFALSRSMTPQGLSAFELIPEIGLARAIEKYDVIRPMATVSDWYVLLRFGGGTSVDDDIVGFLEAADSAGLIADGVLAETSSQVENLWRLRDELPPPRLFDGYMVKYDLAVPTDRISEFHGEVQRVVQAIVPGALPYIFGHVGDGNLHLTVWPSNSETGLLDSRESELLTAIDQLVWDFGGTISAEHGIGQELRERIRGQKDEVEFDLMEAVKHALDPAGILNPGKVLPPPV